MFKEIRSLLQMLDELDSEGAANAADGEPQPAAVDLPQSLEPATTQKPHALVFDTDAPSARSLATILTGSGVTADIHADGASFAAAFAAAPPALVFVDVAGQGDEAIDALVTMSERGYGGGVQLMGAGTMAVIEVVKRMGQRHALTMLPILKKPLGIVTVRQVLSAQSINFTPLPAAAATLDEALAQNWIEFWYQPKIDLARMQIAGVETFARVLHPEQGMLPPGVFMQGATEADLVKLTQQALVSALGAATNFSKLGINLRLAVNVPVRALLDLPIADMVREFGPKHQRWPGLLLDVTEAQVMAELPRVQAVSTELVACNVRLAIDDFGRGVLPPSKLRELPFLELKLDRNFVNGCAADAGRAEVCKSVIDLAHNLDCVAVAVGIEKSADMRALAAMGCGLGQGYLFGQPMPEEQLVEALLQRAVAPERPLHMAEADARRARWN